MSHDGDGTSEPAASFAPARAVAALLAGFASPWYLAGGWALDLFLERESRPHADVDVAIWRGDELALQRHLVGWEWRFVPHGEGRLIPWPRGQFLALPDHEIHAARCRNGDAIAVAVCQVEFLLNEVADEVWRFRRDPTITRPLALVGRRTRDGLPYLAPEIVLLYKAKMPRASDEADFLTALPQLDDEPRRWLGQALARCHPGHAWLGALG